jgi:hypothetical protein
MTYEDEAHQDEEKSDGVGRFSHRGRLSQALHLVSLAATSTMPTFILHTTMTSARMPHTHTFHI